jgi:hypothetical protein
MQRVRQGGELGNKEFKILFGNGKPLTGFRDFIIIMLQTENP